MRLLTRLYMLPQPLIFACTGHSVAAGGLLLLTGDIRIGVRGEYRIGLNEVGIGLALPQTGIELARDLGRGFDRGGRTGQALQSG